MHELSQPLTAIASFSNAAARLVRAAPTPDGRLASAVTHIAEQIVRASGVLDDLRALVAQEERPTTPSAPRLNDAAEEGLVRAVLGLTAEAIVVCDAQGGVVRATRAAEALCGGNPLLAPFDGLFSLHLVLPRGPSAPKGVAAAVLQGEALHEAPGSLVRPDGSRADLVVSAAPLRRSSGEITGCVIAMKDLSELRWVEEKLRESREEARMRAQELKAALADVTEAKRTEESLRLVEGALREADRRKNDFLAVLSHELRNPLSPIRNSLFILERAAAGSEHARRARAVIERQVGQLTRLLDDLLEMTRLARGRVQLHLERVELGPLLQRTAEDHRSAFAAAGVELEVSMAKEPVWVEADAARLGQVVGHLLQNAAKFTGKGGQVTLAMGEDLAAKSAVISVRDSGVGIGPEALGRLFQPFERLDTALDRGRGGLGVGLALVKGLVELHGGRVNAHSEGLGKGAELVVRLPLAVEEGPVKAKVPGRVGARSRRRRVLIIEDNPDVADSLKEALECGHHEVEVARHGHEGLAKARVFQPEVVLCDIGLPGMDGYEVARAFRGDDELGGVLLVALSGHALPEDLQRAQEAGFDRHLSKPPNLEKLEELLAQLPGSPS